VDGVVGDQGDRPGGAGAQIDARIHRYRGGERDEGAGYAARAKGMGGVGVDRPVQQVDEDVAAVGGDVDAVAVQRADTVALVGDDGDVAARGGHADAGRIQQ